MSKIKILIATVFCGVFMSIIPVVATNKNVKKNMIKNVDNAMVIYETKIPEEYVFINLKKNFDLKRVDFIFSDKINYKKYNDLFNNEKFKKFIENIQFGDTIKNIDQLINIKSIVEFVESEEFKKLNKFEKVNTFVKEQGLENFIQYNQFENFFKLNKIINLLKSDKFNNYVKSKGLDELVISEQFKKLTEFNEIKNLLKSKKLEDLINYEKNKKCINPENIKDFVKLKKFFEFLFPNILSYKSNKIFYYEKFFNSDVDECVENIEQINQLIDNIKLMINNISNQLKENDDFIKYIKYNDIKDLEEFKDIIKDKNFKDLEEFKNIIKDKNFKDSEKLDNIIKDKDFKDLEKLDNIIENKNFKDIEEFKNIIKDIIKDKDFIDSEEFEDVLEDILKDKNLKKFVNLKEFYNCVDTEKLNELLIIKKLEDIIANERRVIESNNPYDLSWEYYFEKLKKYIQEAEKYKIIDKFGIIDIEKFKDQVANIDLQKRSIINRLNDVVEHYQKEKKDAIPERIKFIVYKAEGKKNKIFKKYSKIYELDENSTENNLKYKPYEEVVAQKIEKIPEFPKLSEEEIKKLKELLQENFSKKYPKVDENFIEKIPEFPKLSGEEIKKLKEQLQENFSQKYPKVDENFIDKSINKEKSIKFSITNLFK